MRLLVGWFWAKRRQRQAAWPNVPWGRFPLDLLRCAGWRAIGAINEQRTRHPCGWFRTERLQTENSVL